MNIDKKSYYAIIPASVRYDSTICANAKLMYGEITALCNEKGYCWASNDYFGDLYNVHKNTISKWVNQLKKAKYVIIDIEQNYNRKIWINEKLKGDQLKAEGGSTKTEKGDQLKAEDNNTVNIIINNKDNIQFPKVNTQKKVKKNITKENNAVEDEIYNTILEGFKNYYITNNIDYVTEKKDYILARKISKNLSCKNNWKEILSIKINGLDKKVKENPKFWSFTLTKLKYGWNEFVPEEKQKVDLEFINNLRF